MSFKSKIKDLIYWKLNLAFGFFPVKKVAILMYHSVGYNDVFFTVKPEEFKKQMDYLAAHHYHVVSLTSLAECLLRKEEISPKTVVLTFDDGYEDNYFNVFPLLKEYNFPATIFLATGFVGKEKYSSSKIPLQILNWRQIGEMHDSGLIDFEPHTVSHIKLHTISPEEARKEISESQNIIEQNLNKKCRFFAYPSGKYNQEIKDVLRRNDFMAAAAEREGLVSQNEDLFALKRNSIDSSVGFIRFRGKLGLPVDIFRKIFKDE